MARDRKRAKQRRDRGAALGRRAARTGGAGTSPGSNGAPPEGASNGAPPADEQAERLHAPGTIERADLPGALEHVGTEDEFDAALIRGASGAPLGRRDEGEFNAEIASSLEGEAEDALQEPAGAGSGSGGGGVGAIALGGRGGEGAAARPSGAPLRGGNKAIGFLRASWAELQRVQWPDRRQVTQATAVVIGFVAIAGVYLGVADTVAKEIVEFIL